MKLSTKGRYGLRALIDLASHDSEGAVSIQSISERQGISESYLEQLVRPLRKAGLIESVRGAGGGYVLAKPADSISVGDILRTLEGSLDAVTCPANQENGNCEEADFCVTRFVWQRINDSITNTVDAISLGELVRENQKLNKRKIEK
ncbi:MAG: Rrf2 family transcriptional regulator [Fusicatenibacter sp.]|nr:Rrf2 family transcriptional regulator [Fusicatenibacter sp.]